MGGQAKPAEVLEFGEIPSERLQPMLLLEIGIIPSIKADLCRLIICPTVRSTDCDMLRYFTVTRAALIIGVIWGLWHTLSFLLSGTE